MLITTTPVLQDRALGDGGMLRVAASGTPVKLA